MLKHFPATLKSAGDLFTCFIKSWQGGWAKNVPYHTMLRGRHVNSHHDFCSQHRVLSLWNERLQMTRKVWEATEHKKSRRHHPLRSVVATHGTTTCSLSWMYLKYLPAAAAAAAYLLLQFHFPRCSFLKTPPLASKLQNRVLLPQQRALKCLSSCLLSGEFWFWFAKHVLSC